MSFPEDLISVIIPVYNAEKYLNRCVSSVCRQTFKNIEILLINDGSTDNSGIICEQIANEDIRIKVFHQENGGSSIARNTGMDRASGNIIAFVDSDDHIDSTMFEKMYNLMISNNLEVIEVNRDDNTGKLFFDDSFTIENRNEAFERIISSSGFQVWKRLYRKSLIDDMRFIPKIIHQDVFFTIDVLNKIESIGYLNSALYYYNRQSESIIRSKYSRLKMDIGIRATEYLRENIPNTSQIEKIMDQYTVNYYTDHFFLISRNSSLDSKNVYRKKLKREISKSGKNVKYSIRSGLIIFLPIPVIEIIAILHKRFVGS